MVIVVAHAHWCGPRKASHRECSSVLVVNPNSDTADGVTHYGIR
jgi:hypothetical protein